MHPPGEPPYLLGGYGDMGPEKNKEKSYIGAQADPGIKLIQDELAPLQGLCLPLRTKSQGCGYATGSCRAPEFIWEHWDQLSMRQREHVFQLRNVPVMFIILQFPSV